MQGNKDPKKILTVFGNRIYTVYFGKPKTLSDQKQPFKQKKNGRHEPFSSAEYLPLVNTDGKLRLFCLGS